LNKKLYAGFANDLMTDLVGKASLLAIAFSFVFSKKLSIKIPTPFWSCFFEPA
jgi:hypothetical protein